MFNDIIKKKVKGRLPVPLRIGEMHYHLRPAGVRAVIENTIDAIVQHLDAKEINIFVLADYENIFSVKDLKITMHKKGKKVKIRKADIMDLNYDPKPAKNKTQFLKEAYEIKDKILRNIPIERCSAERPFILHIHGLSLGKNPRLSAAIKILAEECYTNKKSLWILNQIHDFAENSRPEMLKNLQYCTGKHDDKFAAEIMYPCTPNVFYATINLRDIENILMVGIPSDRIFFLPNSADTKFMTEATIIKDPKYRHQFIYKLKDFAHKNNFVFYEDRKIILSSLKLMRRKNNIESLLILAALNYIEDKYQLIITLEPHSGKDLEYASMFKDFVRENHLPVLVGIGRTIISKSESRRFENGKVAEFNLVDLFSLSEAVMTNSILEGFGFSFIEGWLVNRVVIGRKIPYVCKDFEEDGLKLSHMYKKMWVPVDWVPHGEERLFNIFSNKVNELRKGQGLKPHSDELVRKQIMKYKCKKIHGKIYIDFKDLDAEMQLGIVKKIINYKESVEELLAINPVIKEMHLILGKNNIAKLISHNKEIVKKFYSLEAKAKRLRNIILLGNKKYMTGKTKCKANNKKVIEKYLDLDYLHPLTI